jgi:hypothetical protein
VTPAKLIKKTLDGVEPAYLRVALLNANHTTLADCVAAIRNTEVHEARVRDLAAQNPVPILNHRGAGRRLPPGQGTTWQALWPFSSPWKVGQGDLQKKGIDYAETFSPTVNQQTLQLLTAIMIFMAWLVELVDVVTAYLYGVLKETIYMTVPKTLEIPHAIGFGAPACASSKPFTAFARAVSSGSSAFRRISYPAVSQPPFTPHASSSTKAVSARSSLLSWTTSRCTDQQRALPHART